MVWAVACVSLTAANNSHHKKPKRSTQKSEILSKVERKDKTEERKMQLIFPTIKRVEEFLSSYTGPTLVQLKKLQENSLFFIEQVILSYSVETIYEESGYFWDLIEA